MITRKEYLDHKYSHREYYAQFVTLDIIRKVKRMIGMTAINNSIDPSFNDIHLRKWDAIAVSSGTNEKMRAVGDYLAPAGKVCILKEAARQIKEEQK